jgi:hypothetical protein
VQMVKKTRAAASRASVARARALPSALGIHPLLADKVDVQAESRRSSMLLDLKSFKPAASSTAISAAKANLRFATSRSVAPSQPKLSATERLHVDGHCDEDGEKEESATSSASGLPHPAALSLRDQKPAIANKRRIARSSGDDVEMARSKKQRKRMDAADFRDEGFYMSHEKYVAPEDAAAKAADAYLRVNAGERGRRTGTSGHDLDEAVMDLVEDEGDGMRKRASVLRWGTLRA